MIAIGEVFEKRRKWWDNLEKARKKVAQSEQKRITAYERIASICDDGKFREMDKGLQSQDPLHFPGYAEKRKELEKRTHLKEAVVTGIGKIGQKKTAIGVFDTRFLMGSLGAAAGEKIVRLTERAEKEKLPLVIISASGGARMQEGLFSLMQMAKTVSAIERFQLNGGLFISFLTNPTTGGVSASFANRGDIILAEPKALICFAGPRVIRQTIGEELPQGFQRAEFLQEHGMIDAIVPGKELRETLIKLLQMHDTRMRGLQ